MNTSVQYSPNTAMCCDNRRTLGEAAMNATNSGSMAQWKELARMLEGEWHGQTLDPTRARALADTLLPQFPELRCTLTHLRERLGAVH
jgi:hypothetical protein